jgi:hypothetical protein
MAMFRDKSPCAQSLHLGVLVPILLSALTAQAQSASERLAIVVGQNRGLNDDIQLKYAEADARKMAKVLFDLSGFSADEVHTILAPTANELRTQLKSVAAQNERSLVFFYYSGHGDARDLHLDGSRLSLAEIQTSLAAIPAKVMVAIVDACESGSMTRAKGATLGPAYEVNLLQDPEVKGRIVITSSSASEVAQESDRIEGSFFTFNWVAGLYGAADANGDGVVTLEEAYRYAHFKTVEQTIGSRAGVQHPSYAFDLQGQGNVVLATLSRSTAQLDLAPSGTRGSYFVLDADKQLLLTEIIQSGDHVASVQLPPGRYRVRKRESDRYLVLDVTASPGDRILVRDADMKTLAYNVDRGSKGIAAMKPVPGQVMIREHGPHLTLGARSGFEPGMTWGSEVEVGYRLTVSHFFLGPRLVFRTSRLHTQTQNSNHQEIDGGLAGGWTLSVDRVTIACGLEASLAVLFETATTSVAHYEPGVGTSGTQGSLPASPPGGALPLAFGVAGFVETGVELSAKWRALAYVRPGATIYKDGSRTKVGPAVGCGLGMAYSF